MDNPAEQSGAAAAGDGKAPHGVIDCDVHPYAKNGIASVLPYMPEAWRERFIRKRATVNTEARSLKFLHPNGTVGRDDARPPCGGAAGSDPKFMIEDLIEKNRIDSVVLNCLQTGSAVQRARRH